MAAEELGIARTGSSEFVVQTLPDGSTAVFEVATRNVYSLNPTAAAAWEACASATTLPRLAAAMSTRLSAPVTEDLAHEAVSELAAAGLVSVTAADLGPSRRAMLKQVAGVAIPMVLVLTGAEQRAHAQGAGSNPQPTTAPPGSTTAGPGPTTPPPGTTRPPVDFELIKGLKIGLDPRVPLPGAEFDMRDVTGHIVAHLITDANGRAKVKLPPATYTIVETDAPGGLEIYEPFGIHTVTLDPEIGAIRDYTNFLRPVAPTS